MPELVCLGPRMTNPPLMGSSRSLYPAQRWITCISERSVSFSKCDRVFASFSWLSQTIGMLTMNTDSIMVPQVKSKGVYGAVLAVSHSEVNRPRAEALVDAKR